MRIAIIGTAGRDKTKPMTLELWHYMILDAMHNTPRGCHLVSGGAAWADHLAVHLFLRGHASELTLHLPAPFTNGKFAGPAKSSGSAANWYHELFSNVIGKDTLAEIDRVADMDHVHGSFEPAASGYGGMFARNAKVAAVENMLAYTFGSGAVPADGGTLDTWNKCKGIRHHVSLNQFI